MAFDITGKLILKNETIQRTESFKTREFVIETNEDINGRIINNYIKFQVVQDRTSLLDRYNLGDMMKVHFNIRGTKWEKNGQTNYITNLDAWRIEQDLGTATSTQQATSTTPEAYVPAATKVTQQENNNLEDPFPTTKPVANGLTGDDLPF